MDKTLQGHLLNEGLSQKYLGQPPSRKGENVIQ